MISNILERLSESPDAIIELLEEYEYTKFKHNSREIRFARNDSGGLNISIRLIGNPACIVKDFVTGEANNVASFIMTQRGVSFRDIMQNIKRILGLDSYWEPKRKVGLFNGLYDHIGVKREFSQITYPENILDTYDRVGNLLWLKDNISLGIQKEFDICFDITDNSIIIPWRNQFGEIIAIKNRVNGMPEEGMSKYYYSIGGNISTSLYGYSENYAYLQNTDIYIGESEKFVLQLTTMGYRSAVSLGSNNLSQQQAALLLSLNPKKIIWLMDEGLSKENTIRNAQILQNYCSMRQAEQYWWNWEDSLSVPSGSKMSPGDCSKKVFEDILKYEIEELDICQADDEENEI